MITDMWKWQNLCFCCRKISKFKSAVIAWCTCMSVCTFILVHAIFVWTSPVCSCKRKWAINNNIDEVHLTCPMANARGNYQKVLSYSFYGVTSSAYFKGVEINAELIAKLYPGWSMRLYHNISRLDAKSRADLCRMLCKFPHLDECHVGDIAFHSLDIGKTFGMLWRFAVLGDPTVDVFGVRDLDSHIYQREVDAVHDWLKTSKTFHIMRDNPHHGACLLGGMWGARNSNNITVMRQLLYKILSDEYYYMHRKEYDQYLLAKYVWPVAVKDMVSHDSFLCHRFPYTTPWPTPRANYTFVGDVQGMSIKKPCPIICRPKDHPNWLYC